MAFVNKLVIASSIGEAPITFDINRNAEDVSFIQIVLDSVATSLGDYTYSYSSNTAGVPTIILGITGVIANRTPYFYVDGIPYSAILNYSAGVNAGAATYIIGEGMTPLFDLNYSIASNEFLLPYCPQSCNKPIFVSELYEGDTYIPYYLDMVDGSTVYLDGTINNSITYQEKGLIEASTALVKGQIVRLFVNGCDTYSESYIVKSRPEDCDFIQQTPCYIKVLDIQVETVDLLFGKIKSLNVASYGDLKYRINNGDWYDSWTQLGKFPLSTGVNLQIKSKANPSCKIEFPMLVIQKLS